MVDSATSPSTRVYLRLRATAICKLCEHRAGLAFACAAGYRKITLWTQSILSAARKLHEAHGFRKVGEELHERFGASLVAQTRARSLTR